MDSGLSRWPLCCRGCSGLRVMRDAEHTSEDGVWLRAALRLCRSTHNQDMRSGNWAWVQERERVRGASRFSVCGK